MNGQKLHKRLKPDLQFLNGALITKLFFEKLAEDSFSDDTGPRKTEEESLGEKYPKPNRQNHWTRASNPINILVQDIRKSG